MGCCGCSLSGSAVAAVVLTLVESILGMAWNIIVLVAWWTKSNGTEPEVPDVLEEATNNTNITLSRWETLRESVASDDRVFKIVLAALVLNSLWLITTLALAVGNAEKRRGMLKPWIGVTVVSTIGDIAATIYFIFQAVKDVGDAEIYFKDAFFSNIYIFLACMFSRGGPIIWIINIALCICVAQRVKEIEVVKKKKMPFCTDLNISPYEAFEAADSTPRSRRPRTPPPDYECLHGPFGQRRRLDCDLKAPPHREDSAELWSVRHAYDNRGLIVETEGWTGIPRPSLKTSRS